MARAVEITVSSRQRARRWRTRWAENQARLAAAEQEGASAKELTRLLPSLDYLKQRLIDYFNVVLAKPLRWTYAGKPLHAA
jgi:hypothetical protein